MIGAGALDVRRLETLLVVARTGSFAGAAEALSFTPSAVSQQMRALEQATGVVLFSRSARGVSLTEAGSALRRHAEVIVEHVAEAEAELLVDARAADSRLRFGSFTSATATFAAKAYGIFRDRYPLAEACFSDGEPYENLALLSVNKLDLAVIFELDGWSSHADYSGNEACREPQFECVPLLDDPYLLVLPFDHPLTSEEMVPLARLAGERVLASRPWDRAFQKQCSDRDIEPHIDLSCQGTGFEALQALVSAGHGLTLMPALALGWLRAGLVARPLEGAPVREVKVAARVAAARSTANRAMMEILTDLTDSLDSSVPVASRNADAKPAFVS